ncbi:importin subunit alpha-6-like isoform X2 [Limulus polyphemus]|uniref:Importin subunit alpha-6-like isoform X2 n=1 Tax=Limulus polyphemus TaxID=6850 RepID=A0ABM1TDR8_LIMPO|nr:importin subunit alpha-6-like isoform X2 [Limulus polyphemus]
MESVPEIRKKLREKLHDARNDQKWNILGKKRATLAEEEVQEEDISLTKLKEVCLHFKKSQSVTLIQQIKRTVVKGDDFIQVFLRVDGCLQILTKHLSGNDTQLQLETAGCVTNLVTGSHKSTFMVLKATAAYLITFLHGSNPLLQDQAAWALGNMAADCQQCRKYLKNQGLEAALVSLLTSTHTSVVESCIFALSSYTKWKDVSIRNLVDLDLVKLISDIITWPDIKPRILTDFSEIMLRLGSEEGPWELTSHWQLIGQTLAKRLNEVSDIDVTLAILRCLTNMVVGDVSDEAFYLPVHSCITKMLHSDVKLLRLECVRLLGNTVGSVLIFNSITKMMHSYFEIRMCATSWKHCCETKLPCIQISGTN